MSDIPDGYVSVFRTPDVVRAPDGTVGGNRIPTEIKTVEPPITDGEKMWCAVARSILHIDLVVAHVERIDDFRQHYFEFLANQVELRPEDEYEFRVGFRTTFQYDPGTAHTLMEDVARRIDEVLVLRGLLWKVHDVFTIESQHSIARLSRHRGNNRTDEVHQYTNYVCFLLTRFGLIDLSGVRESVYRTGKELEEYEAQQHVLQLTQMEIQRWEQLRLNQLKYGPNTNPCQEIPLGDKDPNNTKY